MKVSISYVRSTPNAAEGEELMTMRFRLGLWLLTPRGLLVTNAYVQSAMAV
jgi:hypothetical protein